MSKERELLERWVSQFGNLRHDFNLLTETKELLAQPEPDPEALKKDWVNFGYTTGKTEALRKREPLSEDAIHAYLSLIEPPFLWDEGFCSGIEWAEKQHGIGGQNE